jgi:hypothetical protein
LLKTKIDPKDWFPDALRSPTIFESPLEIAAMGKVPFRKMRCSHCRLTSEFFVSEIQAILLHR